MYLFDPFFLPSGSSDMALFLKEGVNGLLDEATFPGVVCVHFP